MFSISRIAGPTIESFIFSYQMHTLRVNSVVLLALSGTYDMSMFYNARATVKVLVEEGITD